MHGAGIPGNGPGMTQREGRQVMSCSKDYQAIAAMLAKLNGLGYDVPTLDRVTVEIATVLAGNHHSFSRTQFFAAAQGPDEVKVPPSVNVRPASLPGTHGHVPTMQDEGTGLQFRGNKS